MGKWRSAGLIVAVFAAFGTLSFFYHYLDDRANGSLGTARLRAMTEYTGALAGLVIFFALLWLVRRYPPRRGAWKKPLLLYLAAMPLLGACNTTLILLSRMALAPMLGLTWYSYGDLWFRYPMEFSYQIILYAMMIGGILLADLYRENHRRELAAARLQQDLVRAELQNLRLQLQPHFLFNALNTISAVMYEDVGRADAMLTGLSELLRRALATGERQEVPLADELATARLYLELQQARFEQQLQVHFEVSGDTETALVPHFVLQPLLENAVHHGGGAITVRAAREAQGLALEVRDSGRATPAPAGHGIGLRNTGERLERLYGGGYRFDFGPLPEGGFRARLWLPLRA